jgi:YegS/Rv2252/BmrU family lipid kinase
MQAVSETVLIFANPIAGRGKGNAIAERLATRLRRDGLDPRLVLERADRIPDDHLPDRARAAIAIGGDGTVRGVARRLYQRFHKRTPPLLVVPMGTANLLGRHLGTVWSDRDLPSNVSAAIAGMRTLKIDAATANGELFLLMAGIGLDAKVVHELDRVRSGPIDLTSYALPAALALGFYTYPALTVSVDGKRICRDLPAVAFVGNVKEYGTGFPILPFARPDDGLLDVCVLPCANRADAIRQFLRTATGEHVSGEGSIYRKGKRVTIEADEEVPVQIDGEAAGHTPLTCELLPVRLPFIVPPSEM